MKRITIMVSLSLAFMFILGSTPVSMPSASAGIKAQITATPVTNYTYVPVTGSYETYGEVIANLEHDTGIQTTDWGSFRYRTNDFPGCALVELKYGAISANPSPYDSIMDAWWYNGTLAWSGRPFANSWGHLQLLVDDDYVYAFQYSAEMPTPYSGSTKEFNLTVRYTFFKQDPYYTTDFWLRCLNTTSLIKILAIRPWYSDPPGAGWTTGVVSGMGYRYNNDGSVAVGFIGSSPSTDGRTNWYAENELTNRSAKQPLPQLMHGTTWTVIGQTLDDITILSKNIRGMWQQYQPSYLNFNLIYAKHGEVFDAYQWTDETGYSYTPRGNVETIYANGVITTANFRTNPVSTLSKIPIVLWTDDLSQEILPVITPELYWLKVNAAQYEIPFTFACQFENLLLDPGRQGSWIELVEYANGTQWELSDHGYNHTGFNDIGYYATYNLFDLAKDTWHSVYPEVPVYSEAAPGSAWSSNTFDALGTAGAKYMRMGLALQEMSIPPFDYNISNPGSTVFYAPTTALNTFTTALNEATADYYRMMGFHQPQGHTMDFDTDPEKADNIAYWVWLNEHYDFQTMTAMSWYDIWHSLIRYSTVGDQGVYDLTDAYTNHRIWIAPDSNDRIPLLWDLGADSPATESTYVLDRDEMKINLLHDHTYNEIASVKTTEGLTMQMLEYEAMPTDFGQTVFSVRFNSSDGNFKLKLPGLDNETAYRIKMDGATVSNYKLAPDGLIWYNYTGSSVNHTLTIETTQSTNQLFGLFIPVLMMIALVTLVIGFARRK